MPDHGGSISAGNTARLTRLARWGQGNPEHIAYTPDGKYLVVGTSTGLYFYDSVDLSPIHYIDTQTAVFYLAVSPDSQIVAAGTADQVLLYQISDWRLISTIHADANSVYFSPDGEKLALGINADPGYLQLHDVVTGEIVQDFQEVSAVWEVEVSPRGDVIAAGGFSTTIWSLDGTVTDQHGPYVSGGLTSSVSFSPDGELLAEGADYFLHIWRVLENGRLLNYREFDLSRFDYAHVLKVAISPNGRLVAAALTEGICVWNLTTGVKVSCVEHEGEFTFYRSLAWSMDSRTLATASRELGVQLWNVDTGESLASLQTNSGSFGSLVWSPDGQRLAAGAVEGTAYLFNVEDGQVLQRFGSGYRLNSLAFSPNGENLAVGYEDQIIQIWNLDGSMSQTLKGFGYGSSDATFTLDGTYFAASLPESWQAEPQVRFWDTDDWEVDNSISVDDRDDVMLTGFVLSSDEQTAAISFVDMSGSHTDLISIYLIDDGALLTTLEPERNRYRVWIEALAYSPDGTLLAALVSEFDDPNPRILVWRSSDWELLYTQTITAGPRIDYSGNLQDSVSWSPDSTLLAVGIQDGNIQILRGMDGAILTTLTGHTLPVTGVAFSPDGRILASTSLDGTLMLWGIR